MGILHKIIAGSENGDSAEEVAFRVHPEADDFRDIPETREQLESDLQKTQKQAYAKGTLKNLLCQWRSYIRFAKKYNITQWPVSEHIMSLYARFLAYTFHAPKAIKNYLYGIKTLHILMNQPPPNLKDPEVRITMRGIEKLLAHTPKQALPLSPEILTDILGYLDISIHRDLVFWGILLVGE